MWIWTLTESALACAGFYHAEGAAAESDVQRVIFEAGDADTTFVEYEVDLEVDVPAFGWVIPVPGAALAVTDGDPARFLELVQATNPVLDLEEVSDGCRSGKGSELGVDGSGGTSNGVTVIYTGSTPTWDYTVLAATSADDLRAWLTDHGWESTGTAFDAYVGPNWQFVALNLAIDVDGETVGATLPPLRIQYNSPQMIFPSQMARDADRPTMRTTVLVIGGGRAAVTGWGEEDLPWVWDDGESPDYMQYVALPEAIAAIGEQRAYAVTFAGAVAPYGTVTRFDTDAPRDLHDVDATFTVSGDGEDLQLIVSNQGCSAPSAAAMFALLPAWASRRRGRGRARPPGPSSPPHPRNR